MFGIDAGSFSNKRKLMLLAVVFTMVIFNGCATSQNAIINDDAPFTAPSDIHLDGNPELIDVRDGLKEKDPSSARLNTDIINDALLQANKAGIDHVQIVGTYYITSNHWVNRYINPADGIIVPSNMTLDLTGATLIMRPTALPMYNIINVCNAANVTILGGTLIGDKDQHDYTSSKTDRTHEYGFGIHIVSSSSVTVDGVSISGMTGDGIITITYEGKDDCRNIVLRNNVITKCRRQGISVTTGVDSLIEKNTISDISGTDPQYGIDVELEGNFSAKGLIIRGNTFHNCKAGAISCHNGNGYEVYDNDCNNNNIIAVFCSDVIIRDNRMHDTMIRIYKTAVNVDATIPSGSTAKIIFN